MWLSDESECERGRGFLATSEVEGEGETLDDRLLGLWASDVVRRTGVVLTDVDVAIMDRVERTDPVRENMLSDGLARIFVLPDPPPAPAPAPDPALVDPALDPGLLLLLPAGACDVVLDSGAKSFLVFEVFEAPLGVFGLAGADLTDLADLTELGAEPAAEWEDRTDRKEPTLPNASEPGDDASITPLLRSAADDIGVPVRTDAERICEASDLRLLPLAPPPVPVKEKDDEACDIAE